MVSMNLTEDESLNVVTEPANRATFIASYGALDSIHRSFYRSGFSSLTALEETFITIHLEFPFLPFCPFYEQFYNEFGEIIAAGFIEHWSNREKPPSGDSKLYEEISPEDPKILTLDDLAIGFQICLIPLTLGCIVFFGELAMNWNKKRKVDETKYIVWN